jgi:hypothetical protein
MLEQTLGVSTTVGRGKVISRWRASAIHLLISVGIGVAVLLSMLFVWFRPPYLQAAGGSDLFLILLGVDVVLGPMITLIIFNTEKKHLKLDLAVIAAVQVAALVYGLNVMIQARPAYLVFVVDRFELVLASDLMPEELAKASATQFARLPIAGPKLASADVPRDPTERMRILEAALQGADLHTFPQHYVPYEDRKDRARLKAQPLSSLRRLNPDKGILIEETVKAAGLQETDVAWLPMRAKREDMAVLLNVATGDIVSIIAVAPW